MSNNTNIYKTMKSWISLLLILLLGTFSTIAQTHMTKIKDGTISGTVATPSLGSILELESVNKGFLTPRLTTQQRDAIDPLHRTDGLLIFNRTTGCFNYWSTAQDNWLSICGTPPPAVFEISALQCDALAVNGTYQQGEFLTGANYLTIPVTVNQAGTYELLATTTNGYYFSTKGIFPLAGNYTLILEGVGTPNTGYNPGELGDKLTITLNNRPSSCINKYVFVDKAAVDYTMNCNSIEVQGQYYVGKAVDNTNKLKVQVNVSAMGYWNISTNTVNGYSFTGSGTFTSTGVQTVELLATGTPTNSGTNLFNLSANANTLVNCSGIPVTVQSIAYSVDCSSAIVSGEFKQDEPVNDTNFVTLNVDVQATGNTTIQTNTIGGVYFSSGPLSFDELGVKQVVLRAIGTPLVAGKNTYTLNQATGLVNTCSFDIQVEKQPVAYSLMCSSIAINGDYAPSSAMNSENTITLNANVQYIGDYSITTNQVNGVSFKASGSFTSTGLQEIVLTGSGTPLSGGQHRFTLTGNSTNGSANLCNVNIEFRYRNMNILGLGGGTYQPGTASNTQSSRAILQSSNNFGLNGKVKVDGLTIINGGTSQGNALRNQINTNKIDIIVIGYSYAPNQETILILQDFVKNKKGVLVHAQEGGSAINLINTMASSGGASQSTKDGSYTNPIVNMDDPILNGPFGDIRGKAAGSDLNNSYYITGFSNEYINLSHQAGNPNRSWFLKHKTLGYVYIGDAGWTSGDASNNSKTIWPAAMTSGAAPISKNYEANILVYNSIMYANTISWAIKYAQEHIDVNYNVK